MGRRILNNLKDKSLKTDRIIRALIKIKEGRF
jgi:hypothetical protein